MPDFFQWDPKTLSVKVADMDREHEVLIRKMNALHEAFLRQATREELSQRLHELAAYTVEHFRDEEAWMERHAFPGLVTHKIIHQQLLAQVQKHVAEFEASGTLSDALFRFLATWLTSHIRGIDSKYSACAARQAG